MLAIIAILAVGIVLVVSWGVAVHRVNRNLIARRDDLCDTVADLNARVHDLERERDRLRTSNSRMISEQLVMGYEVRTLQRQVAALATSRQGRPPAIQPRSISINH